MAQASPIEMTAKGGLQKGTKKVPFSVCLAADPFPDTWGDWRVLGCGMGMVLVLVVGVVVGGVEC